MIFAIRKQLKLGGISIRSIVFVYFLRPNFHYLGVSIFEPQFGTVDSFVLLSMFLWGRNASAIGMEGNKRVRRINVRFDANLNQHATNPANFFRSVKVVFLSSYLFF